MMQWFPLHINLKHRRCLIVGGGVVALRKFDLLKRSGAVLSIIAPQLCRELKVQLNLNQPSFEYYPGVFSDYTHLVADSALVIAATEDKAVNQAVSKLANTHHVLVNVVDDKQLSSCIMPAIIDRSPVVVTIGTAGHAPTLARLLKAQIETTIPENVGLFSVLLERLRQGLKQTLSSVILRRKVLNSISQQYLNGLISATSETELMRQIEQKSQDLIKADTLSQGKVSIIGAGPGDPELLTLKAHRLLQSADVILYDNLVDEKLLDYARRDSYKIYVGKKSGSYHYPQADINALMVSYAEQGQHVIRLKGGDPSIFSRGEDEFSYLKQNNIPFEIVPGITAALAASARMKIPLTLRGEARGCIFVTAHTCGEPSIEWPLLAKTDKTLVFYMGLKQIDAICTQLIKQGKAETTAIALIENATSNNERITKGTLATLPATCTEMTLQSPGLIIVGQVVNGYEI